MENQPAKQCVNVGDEKTRLECKRIEAEIETIRRPFYKTTSFYVSITPVALGILGLIVTWASGWFDVQRTRIENQKILLQFESEQLNVETINQRAHIASLETNLTQLAIEKEHLTNQIMILEKERNEMRSAKEYFESEAKQLASSTTNSLRLFSELQAVQSERNSLVLELDSVKSRNEILTKIVKSRDARQQQREKIYLTAFRLSLSEKEVPRIQYLDFVDEVTQLGIMELDLKPYEFYFPKDFKISSPTNGSVKGTKQAR